MLEAAGLQTESSETLYLRCLQCCREAGIGHLDAGQLQALRDSLAHEDSWWKAKSDMAEMLAMLPLFETTAGGMVALYGQVGSELGRAHVGCQCVADLSCLKCTVNVANCNLPALSTFRSSLWQHTHDSPSAVCRLPQAGVRVMTGDAHNLLAATVGGLAGAAARAS